MLNRYSERNNSCFFEPIHTFSDFNIDISMFRDIFYVVLVIDFLRDKVKRHKLKGRGCVWKTGGGSERALYVGGAFTNTGQGRSGYTYIAL